MIRIQLQMAMQSLVLRTITWRCYCQYTTGWFSCHTRRKLWGTGLKMSLGVVLTPATFIATTWNTSTALESSPMIPGSGCCLCPLVSGDWVCRTRAQRNTSFQSTHTQNEIPALPLRIWMSPRTLNFMNSFFSYIIHVQSGPQWLLRKHSSISLPLILTFHPLLRHLFPFLPLPLFPFFPTDVQLCTAALVVSHFELDYVSARCGFNWPLLRTQADSIQDAPPHTHTHTPWKLLNH